MEGKQAILVVGSHSMTIQGDMIEVFKANHSEEVTDDYYLKASNIVIEAMSNITLKVGGSYIVIEAGGIEIKGPQTTVKGDAMTTIQGGMVKIN